MCPARARPDDEQLNRGVLPGVVTLRGGHSKRRDRIDPLLFCFERLPARGDDMHRRVGAQQRLGHSGRGIDHMLAIVEHEQQLFPAQRIGNMLR
jgi:hypothetical protein